MKNKILINAMKLDEDEDHKFAGNFYHVYFYLKALWKIKKDANIRIMVDQFTCPVFSKFIEEENLIKIRLPKPSALKILMQDVHILRSVYKYRFSVYHRPTGQIPVFALPCRTVSTIADLNFMSIKMNPLKILYKKISYSITIKRSDHIIAVSRYTMRQIQKHFKTKKKIYLVHHGTNVFENRSLRLSSRYPSYWLTFGHQSHKNVETSIQAISIFNERHKRNDQLLVIGTGNYIEKLKLQNIKNGYDKNIHFIGNVSSAELAGLYLKANGLLFLSLFEGFGLPVLEAMSCGCPVISSDACSLPEVGGKAVEYVKPRDAEKVVDKMNLIAENIDHRKMMIKRGYLRSKQFTWEKSAREMMQIYNESKT
jgi:glycosyltransferase involved in cell wall biosynthesis